MLSGVLWICLFTQVASQNDDVGFLDLFEDALEEAEDATLSVVGALPSWLAGTFYQVGPARWSIGDMKFTHALDGFGKLHKFTFDEGSISFTSKFIQSGALNQSVAKGEIVWGVLAQETSPPRHNPGPTGLSSAPNDNNNVNPWMFERGHLAVLSDTPTILDVDPSSLNFLNETGMRGFKNASDPLMAPMMSGASAHPHCADDGSYIGLREAERMAPLGNSRMAVYKLHPQDRAMIQDIVHLDVPRASYTHSFGMTKDMSGGDYAVVVTQPVYSNMMKIAMTGTLSKGFETPKDAKTMVNLLPMDNSKAKKTVSIEHDPFFFGHFLNTYSPEPGKIVFDLDRQSEIFFDRFSFDVQSDKQKRDNWAAQHGDAYSTPTRFEVDIEAGTITSKPLFPDVKTQCAPNSRWCEFDLFKLHPDDYSRPYCGFWSQQVFFNSSSYTSQAVVRAELCGADGPKVAASWYRPNTYPGEVHFVPKPGSSDKTEGVVIFKVYEGDTKKSKIVVADAHSLKTIAYAELPVRVPFTVHGNFYPKGSAGHCIASESKTDAESVFV